MVAECSLMPNSGRGLFAYLCACLHCPTVWREPVRLAVGSAGAPNADSYVSGDGEDGDWLAPGTSASVGVLGMVSCRESSAVFSLQHPGRGPGELEFLSLDSPGSENVWPECLP